MAQALFDISDMVGEFEKPRYVDYDAGHLRACPQWHRRVLALPRQLPDRRHHAEGDGVVIDPYVCAGCGNCATVCPTGAVRYRMPESESLLTRLRTLLRAYAAGAADASPCC